MDSVSGSSFKPPLVDSVIIRRMMLTAPDELVEDSKGHHNRFCMFKPLKHTTKSITAGWSVAVSQTSKSFLTKPVDKDFYSTYINRKFSQEGKKN